MKSRVPKKKGQVMCILCGKMIRKNQKMFILAVDRPVRLDLEVHRKCFQNNDENSRKNAVKQHIT